MVSTFSPNIQLEEPARGDQVGVWDTPVNANMTVLDLILGGRTTVSGAAGSVVLSAAQFQCKTITFNSTLLASIAITFPTSFTKSYEVFNQCSGSSAFVITLQTTAGGQVVCCPPGEIFEVINDGTNVRFKNFDRVGSYWDYGGSSVPSWVAGCTVPPYLNCDGTAFSTSVYPVLANILGGATLPDSRGRYRANLNQTTARITSGTSLGGVDGNTAFASGGVQTTTLSSQNLPPVPVTDPGHQHLTNMTSPTVLNVGTAGGFAFTGGGNAAAVVTIATGFTSITAGSTSPTNFSNLPPTYIGGITMIRAA